MRELLGVPTITYCEAASDALIKRPWYAISNLAFFIVAFLIWRRDRTTLGKQFALTTLLIGVLSFVYDSTYTYIAQLADLTGMLLFATLLLSLNARRLGAVRYKLWLACCMIVALVMIILLGHYAGNIIFGTYIVAVLITELMIRRGQPNTSSKYWALAMSVFLLGFAAWLLDSSHTICFDIGLLNGRAIFHYTSATTMYLLYKHYAATNSSLHA